MIALINQHLPLEDSPTISDSKNIIHIKTNKLKIKCLMIGPHFIAITPNDKVIINLEKYSRLSRPPLPISELNHVFGEHYTMLVHLVKSRIFSSK